MQGARGTAAAGPHGHGARSRDGCSARQLGRGYHSSGAHGHGALARRLLRPPAGAWVHTTGGALESRRRRLPPVPGAARIPQLRAATTPARCHAITGGRGHCRSARRPVECPAVASPRAAPDAPPTAARRWCAHLHKPLLLVQRLLLLHVGVQQVNDAHLAGRWRGAGSAGAGGGEGEVARGAGRVRPRTSHEAAPHDGGGRVRPTQRAGDRRGGAAWGRQGGAEGARRSHPATPGDTPGRPRAPRTGGRRRWRSHWSVEAQAGWLLSSGARAAGATRGAGVGRRRNWGASGSDTAGTRAPRTRHPPRPPG